MDDKLERRGVVGALSVQPATDVSFQVIRVALGRLKPFLIQPVLHLIGVQETFIPKGLDNRKSSTNHFLISHKGLWKARLKT